MRTLLAILLLCILLGACGQKGPLRLPDAEAPPATSDSEDSSEDETMD